LTFNASEEFDFSAGIAIPDGAYLDFEGSAGDTRIRRAPSSSMAFEVDGGQSLTLTNNVAHADVGLTIGGATEITLARGGSASLDFGATAAGTCDTAGTTISASGGLSGDAVYLGITNTLATADANQSFWGWFSANDTVSVKRCCHNLVSACSDPAAATIKAFLLDF
jgi:hypothetical protein